MLSPNQVAAKASNATDKGEEPGVHFSKKLKRMTMPSTARAETVYVAPAHEHAETLDLKTMALPKADGGVPYAGPASVPQVKGATAGPASNATDEGQEKGVHYSEPLKRLTKSASERARLAGKAPKSTGLKPGQYAELTPTSISFKLDKDAVAKLKVDFKFKGTEPAIGDTAKYERYVRVGEKYKLVWPQCKPKASSRSRTCNDYASLKTLRDRHAAYFEASPPASNGEGNEKKRKRK